MMRKAGKIALAVIVLLLLAGVFQGLLDRQSGGWPGEEGGFPAEYTLLSALGGIRQYLAYVLFIKTDNLHHAYYGSFEQEAELLPYLVAVTYLDPHYVDAFYVGTEILYDLGKREEAFRFNLRGLELNPDSGDLRASLADLYLREKQNLEAAEMFREALEAGELRFLSRDFVFMGLVASLKAAGRREEAARALDERVSNLRAVLATEELDPVTQADLVKGINDLESLREASR